MRCRKNITKDVYSRTEHYAAFMYVLSFIFTVIVDYILDLARSKYHLFTWVSTIDKHQERKAKMYLYLYYKNREIFKKT